MQKFNKINVFQFGIIMIDFEVSSSLVILEQNLKQLIERYLNASQYKTKMHFSNHLLVSKGIDSSKLLWFHLTSMNVCSNSIKIKDNTARETKEFSFIFKLKL